MVVVVLDAIGEGVDEAALAAHWVHLEGCHSKGPSNSIFGDYFKIDGEGRVLVGEVEGLEGEEICVCCVGGVADPFVAVVGVVFGKHQEVVQVDIDPIGGVPLSDPQQVELDVGTVVRLA